MNISPAGLDLIKSFEAFSPHVYKDVGGVYTIGYGHTRFVDADSPSIDEVHATMLLQADLLQVIKTLNANVTVPQHQFDALCSLVFNIGITAFKQSTLLKLLNNGSILQAADQFLRWNKVNGIPVQGLTNRRITERKLFLSMSNETSA